jgi:EAL domain-containing protein (putative c-di-GMP-specific phosphodiesterase class I)
MAFNVSPLSLVNIQMPRKICSLVRAYGIPFDMITIEVTETAHADDSPSVLDSLTWLRMQGFKISIDDFGTGYSSLQLLSQMPFTEIKIDRTFVTGMSNHWKSTTILESVVELADKLHMRTVAEGIETKKEYEFIRALGCRNGQGFYLGHPMRNSELIAWVKRDLSLASPSALSMRGASETELPMSMACA